MSASLDFLAHHYPDIHLNVLHRSEQHPSLDALIKEVADILILPGTVLNEHYLEHHCWSDHYVLVAARSKQATPQSFAELSQVSRYVAWRHPGVERLHQQLASAQVRLSQRGELTCLDTLLDLVAKRHCISILPRALLNGRFRELESIPLPLTVMRHISVVARPASLLSNAANAVIQALKKPPVAIPQPY
ncbi:LysR substrate-binding domain-containing protein [Pseudomonas ficuserectae]|uniref:LysR substrate-binding domain-containing protein n=1 Tax=Pseudomonas syringae group TaxID=136849 RepID=UPI001E410499|nr:MULTISPECIES: LysR substrate-binding domain-containing protein [Pseudomonas syringae group]MDU8457172.1 LysR substrate-binding domain-containing protein [Pseudomonas syringae group sp. J254-4]MDU8541041.1 LysR substrate-binding domain-containing protein [Pseudomonas syringae group sp. J248-6]WIO60995.1 LysR substrate-binding domain-containing protein [Pseudomonas amygdali pv. lachrymans]